MVIKRSRAINLNFKDKLKQRIICKKLVYCIVSSQILFPGALFSVLVHHNCMIKQLSYLSIKVFIRKLKVVRCVAWKIIHPNNVKNQTIGPEQWNLCNKLLREMRILKQYICFSKHFSNFQVCADYEEDNFYLLFSFFLRFFSGSLLLLKIMTRQF